MSVPLSALFALVVYPLAGVPAPFGQRVVPDGLLLVTPTTPNVDR